MAEKRTEKLTKTNKIKNTKELVFDIVVKDIKDYGYDEVTVRTICEKAEISTGMFYRLFGSKEGVLNYYYERMKMRFDQEVRPELEKLPVKDQLLRYHVWLCQFTTDLGADFTKHFISPTNDIMNTEIFANQVRKITEYYLENAIAGGFQLSPGRTPYMVSKDLCVIAKGCMFDWSAQDGDYDLPEFISKLLNRILEDLL